MRRLLARWGLVLAVGFSALTGCNTLFRRNEAVLPPVLLNAEEIAGPQGPQPEWLSKGAMYRPAADRVHDLIHTRLEVKFDFAKQHLIGTATLDFKPYFYPVDTLVLDAKGFDLREVAMVDLQTGAKRSLEYSYNDKKITVRLGRLFTREEKYRIFIDYTAKPNELKTDAGGQSDAITDRKGLYFIDPLDTDPNTPTQIWTQGETEYSSCWFPTIEATNERTTQEIFITVQDRFTTLSNGLLTGSVKNADGTRTDHWVMDQPHTPYLFMMAVGEFAVVKDKWRNIEVSYYVEKEYEKHARMIFGNTPEMIEFFSNYFGVDYPWKKYSQIVVRDFVSGAMENTTAVIHVADLQHDHRQHLDETEEDYISHELTHHWFGDYVTCESWANLPLNESFASYGEHLWREYKYGAKDADYHLTNDFQLYFMEAASKREPLIRYNYDDPQDMFDRHSYQKGACTLHMLRHMIGEEAFKLSIKHYLKAHAFSPVEIDELRMSFEEVTGLDLKWFFDQWFMKVGHPDLKIDYEYSNIDQKVTVKVKQTQDLRYQPLFRLPAKIQIDYEGGTTYFPVTLHSRDTVFSFPSTFPPRNAVFDSEQILIASKEEEKPSEWWQHQAEKGKNFRQQYAALNLLAEKSVEPSVFETYKRCLKDDFWAIRETAVFLLTGKSEGEDPATVSQIRTMAVADPKASVRAAALGFLGSMTDKNLTVQSEETLEKAVNDSSYSVLANALMVYYEVNPEKAAKYAKANIHLNSGTVMPVIAQILTDRKEPDARAYIRKCLVKTEDPMGKLGLMKALAQFLEKDTPEDADVDLLKNLARNDTQWYVRLLAMKQLFDVRDRRPDVAGFISEMKLNEKNPRLKELYEKNF